MTYNHFYFQNVCVGEGIKWSPKRYGMACLCGAIRNGGRRSVFGIHQKWQCRVSIGILWIKKKYNNQSINCLVIGLLVLVTDMVGNWIITQKRCNIEQNDFRNFWFTTDQLSIKACGLLFDMFISCIFFVC